VESVIELYKPQDATGQSASIITLFSYLVVTLLHNCTNRTHYGSWVLPVRLSVHAPVCIIQALKSKTKRCTKGRTDVKVATVFSSKGQRLRLGLELRICNAVYNWADGRIICRHWVEILFQLITTIQLARNE